MNILDDHEILSNSQQVQSNQFRSVSFRIWTGLFQFDDEFSLDLFSLWLIQYYPTNE